MAKLVGGVALLRCVGALDEMKLNGDQAVGVQIVKRALEEPIRQIVIHAGVEGAVIVMEVKKNKKAMCQLEKGRSAKAIGVVSKDQLELYQ